MIEFFDAEGNTITALDLVAEIVVSASLKIGVAGSFGSSDAFQSLRAPIPYGLPHDTIRGIADDLYEECRSAVVRRMGAAQPVITERVDASEIDKVFGTVEERKAEREAQKQAPAAPASPAPSASADAPVQTVMLQYPPKSGERKPGQRWVLECDQYLLAGNRLEFWRSDSKGQYADAMITDASRQWPTDWIPRMKNDGKKHDFAKTVLVTCSVSQNKNKKNGNYYVDVDNIEIKKVAAA